MIENILSDISIQIIKQENGHLLCVCPDCQTKHLYINRSSGLWDCKHGCGRGNLFEFVRKVTGWADKQCFELLEKHGHKADTGPVPAPKPKDISWFANQLRGATEMDLRPLCQIKQVNLNAFLKFSPMIHKIEPLVCIPAYDPSNGGVCGYLRVGKEGQLVKLKSGKEEKYPAIGEHGLYGLTWLKTEKPEMIMFCEGWRDALAAIQAGHFATASSGGASTFKDSWLALFKGKTVYICMDCDTAGQKAAQRAAEKIYTVASAVYIVKLHYEITESHGKDLHDYLVIDKGNIDALLKQAAKYEPTQFSGDIITASNDEPDTIAERINEYCRIKLNTSYRYNSIDGWSVYRANRYRRIEDEKELDIFIRQCLRKCLIEVREKQEDGTIKIKFKPLKKKGSRFVGDVKGFWTGLSGVYLKPESNAPKSLDGKFDAQHTIALKNGLLDFSAYPYKLSQHTGNFYTFNYLDFDWNGETDSSLWIDFLVFATNSDAERFILLQQWAGYLLKHSTEQQKFLLCYGDGANGKSVFFDVMMAMLGKENCSTVPLSKFNDVHQLTQVYGKMANITDESSKGLEEEAETALKQYTGGTQVMFKRLYNNPFSAYPTAKIMIATNKLPHFVDTSNGIWRRILLVPFDAVISEDKQDKKLAEKIKATEMPGVLKWALEGLRMLEEQGRFIEPKACKDALEQYKHQMNPLVVFLEENFEPTKCDIDKIETRQLRKWYEQWCEEHGYKAKNDTNVGIQMKKLWPYVEKKRMRQGMDRSMYYAKLKLKNDSEFNNES